MMTLPADTTHSYGPGCTRTAGRRVGVNRGTRILLALSVCAIAWLGGGATARATVGVPVSIDSFGNPDLPVAPFTRTVIPLPLPHTSTTPPGTFSESNGVGTMTMSGAGNGFSGITLRYTPTSGSSIDLTGGGSNGQIFIDFAEISGTDPSGVTTYMTATDAGGNVATSPADAVGNFFAFNAAFPFSGFHGFVDFTHITQLDITFVYPTANSGGGSLVVEVNRLWASPISGVQPSPPTPTVTAPANAIGVAGAVVAFTVSFGGNQGAAPVTYNPPSNIGVRAQDLTVSGTAFGGATPQVVVTGGPSTYIVGVSGMTKSGGITVHVPAGIVDDAWAQLNSASTNDPTVAFTFAIPPSFQSANHATFPVGSSTMFTADADGGQPAPAPTPALSISSGSLPPGLSFHDNGDGTASIIGKPAAGTGGVVPLTLEATNFAGTVTQPVTLTILEAPTISSAPAATFTAGAAGSVNITTGHDYPLPHLSIPAGSLPGGVAFTDNRNGAATISGTPAAGTGGTYKFSITANNGVPPNGEQSFTLTVLEAPTISSAATASLSVGSAGSVNITTAHDYPLPHLSISAGSLPAGVTFKDNGNGTATISGTPAAGAGSTYTFPITANNGVAPNGEQSFTLTINEAPVITSAPAARFTAGAAGSFTLTTGHDYPAATTLSIRAGSLPAGVTFKDNGNGTATISGTPAAGAGSTYTFNLTASNGVAPDAVQPFTLTINEAPTITSAPAARFTAGAAGSFTVTTGHDYPAATTLSILAGSLPAGVTFKDNGNGTATISGTPAAGAGSTYTFNLTASNGTAPNAVQPFTLTVNQTPSSMSSPTTAPLSTSPQPTVPQSSSSPMISGEAIVGTTLSFRLNQTARLTLTLTHRVTGRTVHGKCVAQNRRNRHRPSCKRTVVVATATVKGHPGRNRVGLTRLLHHGRKLRPGRYTIIITATKPGIGKQAQPQRLSFTVAR
jgi:hypothetical protein